MAKRLEEAGRSNNLSCYISVVTQRTTATTVQNNNCLNQSRQQNPPNYHFSYDETLINRTRTVRLSSRLYEEQRHH